MKFLAFFLGAFAIQAVNTVDCPQGQIADANRICVQPKFIQGCHRYKTSSICQECEFRYLLNDEGLCQFSQISNGPCCLEKDIDGKCIKCNKGLYLTPEGTCEQSNIIGCLQKDLAGKCVNCASNFILTQNGQCQQGIKHCTKYVPSAKNQQKHCQSCKTGFSLINNSCLKNKILGCAKEENHICFQCYTPFTERENHCQISNCVSYNQYGCTHCDCGFYLTPKNICKELQRGCIRYQRGVCTDCHSNFRLKGGSCIIQGCQKVVGLDCQQCQDEYNKVEGTCQLKNCLVWNDGSCQVCKEGFRYSDGQCVPRQLSSIRLDNQSLS